MLTHLLEVCLYAHILYKSALGTRYFDDNWFYSGVGERKLTHLMDFLDSAMFIKTKGLSKKLGILGHNESGSITALAATFQEPFLFESTVVYNGISDIIGHLFEDIEHKQGKEYEREFDNQKYMKIQEFGDIHSKHFYDSLQLISPYHMPHPYKINTDILLTVDADFKYVYHSRKLMCKLREVGDPKTGYMFYKEYPTK